MASYRYGSSPRLRGTRWTARSSAAATPVHPRACGEHEHGVAEASGAARFIPAPAGNTPAIAPLLLGAAGSSPRLRGTLSAGRSQPHGHRFIPAPAGNTHPHDGVLASSPVHPRACGEHRACQELVIVQVRFIPAPAGNTVVWRASSTGSPVHPRACGEHTSRKMFLRKKIFLSKNAPPNLCRMVTPWSRSHR